MPFLQQREPFIFKPGQVAVLVASGTAQSGAQVVTVNADTTYNTTEVVYEPKRAGLIDGVASGGIVSGQVTIGVVAASGTPNAKLIIQVRNKNGTWVTILALTNAFATSTTEIFKTYESAALLTVANWNAVPFGFRIGVQSSSAVVITARVMTSSFLMGEMECGT